MFHGPSNYESYSTIGTTSQGKRLGKQRQLGKSRVDCNHCIIISFLLGSKKLKSSVCADTKTNNEENIFASYHFVANQTKSIEFNKSICFFQ